MSEQLRILHVDDDPALLDLTAELLERVDPELTVRSEADPTTVLDRLNSEPVDCIVSDCEMPGCDGIELCERIRHRRSELPFVLFTSRDAPEIVERATAAGATDYVQKAPGVEQYELLANRIRDAVDRYRVRKRLATLRSASGAQIDPSAIGSIGPADVELD